ncbi:hypothetical protein [Telmatospirillum siberiense]|uniref:Uncharacterized protein n=1 Tax=Telmatospirillum siberiense TaxID=382514 RepID=A0A2N3PXC3_9PROT|nr:hypothetical protein [Telmatospirillum siberiense]PKU25056.1 hypothetical protein CWS72_07535 [Telmatospirillum siberiense]
MNFLTVVISVGNGTGKIWCVELDMVREADRLVIGVGRDRTCDGVLTHSVEDPDQLPVFLGLLGSFLFKPSLVGIDIADLNAVLRRGQGIRVGVGHCDLPGGLTKAGLLAMRSAGVGPATRGVALEVEIPKSGTLFDVDICAAAVRNSISGEADFIVWATVSRIPGYVVTLMAVT